MKNKNKQNKQKQNKNELEKKNKKQQIMSDEGYTWKTYIVDFEEELSITNESLTMPGADAT